MGYLRRQVRNHPILGTCKIYEHRLVMTNKLGRKLKRNEYVHHKKRGKKRNNPGNLEIMSPAEHVRHHLTGKKRSLKTRRKISRGLTGRIVSKETRRKMSKRMMGKRWSAERRRNHAKRMMAYFKQHRKLSPTGKPWEKLGMSRRTWYRQKQRRRDHER